MEPGDLTILLPGDVRLELARIPAGSFVMGSPETERGLYDNEGPQTNVSFSRGFYMGRYEITQAQWVAVMNSWPATAPSPTHGVAPNNPAYSVSWTDAQNFIAAINAHIVTTGQGSITMRLPKEAEWEYAARAGTTTRFYFGDSLSVDDECQDDGLRRQFMWYCGNSNSQSQHVSDKLPNAFGLYDMHGGVWEWCQDWYGRLFPGGIVSNPTGPSSGTHRVIRGGSGGSGARGCRSANRNFIVPSGRSAGIGFRIASTDFTSITPTTTPTQFDNIGF